MLKKLVAVTTLSLILIANTTKAQYVLVKHLLDTTYDSEATILSEYKGELFCFAHDRAKGTELHKCDGTTFDLVADIQNGSQSSLPNYVASKMVEVDGKLFFIAADSVKGTEVFMYDGTNTPEVAFDIMPNVPGVQYYSSSNPRELTELNNELYLISGYLWQSDTLWRYNPSTQTLKYIMDIGRPQGLNFSPLHTYNNKLYFSADLQGTTIGNELYEYDPVSDKIALVAEIDSTQYGSNCQKFANAGGKMYFTADDNSTYERELFVYDGSTTKVVADIHPGQPFKDGAKTLYTTTMEYKNMLYATLTDNGTDFYVYRVDPSNNSISKAWSKKYQLNNLPYPMAVFQDKMYWSIEDGSGIARLHVYNGVDTPVAVSIFDPSLSNIITPNGFSYLVCQVVGKSLFFTGSDDGLKAELFEYRDTTGTTSNIASIANDNTIEVYPNPARDMVNVLLPETHQCNTALLIDQQGKLVKEVSIPDGEHTINIHTKNIASGTYILKVIGDNTSGYYKNVLISK